MISNPADREKLFKGLQEISNSMTRVEAEKDFQKDAVARIANEVDIDKKMIRKLANVYHKQNKTQMQQEQEELFELYDAITKTTGT